MSTFFKIQIACVLLLPALLSSGLTKAQEQAGPQKTVLHPPKPYRDFDRVSLGLGLGLDYGGIGLNLLVYPQKNIGLFAGGGYNFNGFGYNTGLKVRFFNPDHKPNSHFFLTGMYGYHTVFRVKNANSLSKTFYGASVGIGVDTRFSRKKDIGYGSFALIVPIRSAEVTGYLNDLKSAGATIRDPLPFALSIGYRIAID